MKRRLLLALALMTATGSYAQTTGYYQLPKPKISLPRAYNVSLTAAPVVRSQGDPFQIPFNTTGSYSSANKVLAATEALIGNSQYDLQSNSAILNRFIRHSDGTMSATWTTLCIGCSSNPDRGTGYNYFDGVAWGPVPATRIEPTQRSGFPNIVVTASNKEMVIAHSSTVPGMLLVERAQKGTGAWTENPTALGQYPNDTWAKAIAGGANGETVHAVWNGTGITAVPILGQDGPLFYSRSLDGGATWPILRSIIPALDSNHYYGWGADSYAMDSKGDEIAMVVGDFTTDELLLKSMDNGNTWTSKVIEAFPTPLYNDTKMVLPDLDMDGFPDTLYSPSGDAHVLIDNNGLCHVWYTHVRIVDSDTLGALSYYPNGSDGLFYWNENFGVNPSVEIEAAEDLNGNGVLDIPVASAIAGNGLGVYRGGITQMPTAGVDAANNLYVSYQTFAELADTLNYTGTGHKHIYVIKSMDGGTTWSIPYDVNSASTDSSIQEGVFACMAKRVDGFVHLIYQRDYAPGLSLSTNTTEAGWNADPSDIIYAKVPVGDLLLGVNDNVKPNDFNVSQNSPNPTTGITSINLTTTKTGEVTFTVTDVVGKNVYAENRGTVSPGSYTINFNTNQINKGLYFYTVKAGDNSVTKKMIVE